MAVVDGVDDDEDDQGEEPAARSSFDLGAVLGQLVPALCLALGSRGGADAQKAAAALGQAARALPAGDAEPKPVAPQTSGVTKKGDARNESSKAVVEAPAVAATPADAMAHFLAIQNQLSLDERAFVQGVISDLTLADLGAWREQLTRLSVDDAVALIRGEIAKSKEKAS
jgi:hypothetical protein